MADDVTSAASAAAAPTAGAAAPAPSAPSASPEPASLEDAARGAMSGGDPAEDALIGAPAAEPAGEGSGTPAADGAEGEGQALEDDGGAAPEGEGEVDELKELDFADLPAARKEYLKRDPEARAAWFFRQEMGRLGMTVPEAREFRKLLGSPEGAQYALRRAVDFGTLERALLSDAPDAHLQAFETLRQKFGKGADNLVRTVAQHLDKVDPQAALERDSVRMGELLATAKPKDQFEQEALQTVWEMLERSNIESPQTRAANAPLREENERLRAEKAQRETAVREHHVRSTQQAAETELRSMIADTFKGPRERHQVPQKVLDDLGEALFRETFDFLKGHQLFQEQFINARDRAPSAEEGRKAALKEVQRWAMPFLRDLAARRLRPYTQGVLRANQRRIQHAKDVSTLAELGGTAAAAGTPVRLPEGASIEDMARAALR